MARRKRKAKRTVTAATPAPATPRTSPTPQSAATSSDSPASNSRSTTTADADRPAAETAVAEPVVAERVAADLDQQLASITELLRQSVSDETRLEAREQQLREREAELQRRSDDLDHRRREHARRVRQHRQLANVQQTLAEQADGFTDLLAALADTVARQSESTLGHDREAIADLQALAAEVEVKQQTIDCLKADLDGEQLRNRELQAELDQQLCERLFDTPAAESQDDTLRQELDDARARLAELEQQNQELATKLADHSVRGEIATSTGAVTESMSWEERKKLILQRLENEDQSLAHGDFGDADAVRDELQSLRAMVQATDKEIARRDSEIAELRQLLEQQSDTVGDVAIGAAAIAGLLDQDDLVREEREKLQQIQTEWQDKLRQAEIEVSLERARLARERQEIEKRNVELKDRMLERPGGGAREEELDANGKPTRKWLAKLGLDK